MIAFHQLRLWLTKGTAGFTDSFYWGSEPLDGTGPQVDVLITTWENMESRWLFDKASGQLVGLDSRRVEDVEACELRFGEFRQYERSFFPGQIKVSYTGTQLLSLETTAIEVRQPAPEDAGEQKEEGGQP